MRHHKLVLTTTLTLCLGTIETATAANESIRQFAGRIGVLAGTYEGELEVPGGELSTDQELAYGITTGLTYRIDSLFFDVALEYFRQEIDPDSVDRTDVLPSVGIFIGDHWSAFAGYRIGKQGDGLFDDEIQDEQGFFFGIGAGGFSLGSFNLNASIAYNLSEIDGASDEGISFSDVDYDGVVLKIAASPKSSPQHSFEFRAQRFEGDGEVTDGTNFLPFELTETYLFGGYIYRFVM